MCGDAEKTLALLAGAAKDFDRQRLEIVGSAIKGPLGQIPIETLVADTKMGRASRAKPDWVAVPQNDGVETESERSAPSIK
jgi:hypothetical protein